MEVVIGFATTPSRHTLAWTHNVFPYDLYYYRVLDQQVRVANQVLRGGAGSPARGWVNQRTPGSAPPRKRVVPSPGAKYGCCPYRGAADTSPGEHLDCVTTLIRVQGISITTSITPTVTPASWLVKRRQQAAALHGRCRHVWVR